MIEKMKKVSLVVMDKSKTASLEKLREIGIVHLEKKDVSSEKLVAMLERKRILETASGVLRSFAPKKNVPAPSQIPADIAAFVLDLFEKRKMAQDAVFSNTKEISRIEKWGGFEPEDIKYLSEKGVVLYPYEIPAASYAALGDQKVIVLGKDKAAVFCVAVGTPLEGESPFVLPEKSLADLQLAGTRLKFEVTAIEEKLTAFSSFSAKLDEEAAVLAHDIEFETAQVSMDKADDVPGPLTVSWISGFVPASELGVLKRASAENGWALYACDPDTDDKPPTLTKNNAFVRIIKPLFDFLGTVPGYREYDISPSYLIFFCLFFAMIFGDAAYGSIILLIVSIAGISIKVKTGKLPDAIKLFGLLALCTIGWGAVTGSWFAVPYENLPASLQALVLPQFNVLVNLSEFPGILAKLFKLPPELPSNPAQWNIQFLCFTVAVIQLVYSHIKNIKKLLPSAVALAQLGWLVMMIGLYFLVLFMLLKVPLPSFSVYFIGIGLGMYFVFANQTGGNVIINVFKSFSNFLPTFLNAVSSFADIISYIRLFAVGLAGSSIAQSFNAMSGVGGINGTIADVALKTFAAVLILVFGHSLNMVMNALSVVVHGVRLNLLEYAGNHLGMEWSGYAYKPFALLRKDKK
ncbi:MAG: V-type ATP synthase subunit I [Spirochaetaceae bacterium]|jgi:V/A-type H+-transporting ATPase subunit I|nr:V-type ATP synthase subunit I [Spirochaetaceae bacterium]